MERPHLKRQPTALVFAIWFLVGLAACAGYTSSGGHGNPGGSVAPMITAQPTNQTVNAGATATFTATATGTAPLSYQWQSAPSGSTTYTNIAGSATSSYSLMNTTTAESGMTFRVVISNGVNPSATSNAATLTVNAATVAPSITTQPTNKTVNAGGTATFTVVAAGTAPLSYQWQSAPSGSVTYTNIAGATSSSYSLMNTTTAQSGMTFRVVVTNSVNPPATSNAATLTVNAAAVAPSITTQPTNQTVNAGGTATFTVVAAGTAPLSYQWQSAPSGSATYANIAGATSSSYSLMNATTAQSGMTFRVVVSNGVNPPATSNAATLTVNAAAAAPSITTQPTNQTVTAGGTATFTVVATGTAPLSYQWQSAPSGSATYTNIAGAMSSSYSLMNTTTAESGMTFRVVVSNGVNPPATSGAATLTVNAAAAAPSITTQPTNQTVTAGGTATFTVVATGTAPLSYQWQSAPSGSMTYTNIAGAASSSYSLMNTTTAESGMTFRVVISNG